ncbi:unnamed protein product [Bursaphelenchus xylophilus]|uniref:(pine wood nematode) hypothetical protein n=1 Tax=Bursaphelenchus xylophilus TaxID=6326 RepID=A0A1I7RTL7_BURXY|nr:unnamed protein product [Bursaphelenchus xylophilus]CAG9122338.1 unnamed protein product [Bursaphelenchus xylophilus]
MWSLLFPSTLFDFFACDLTRAFCAQNSGDECGPLNICQYLMLFLMVGLVVFLVVMVHLCAWIINEIHSLSYHQYDDLQLTANLEHILKLEAGISEAGDYHHESYAHLRNALRHLNRDAFDM